MRNPGRAAGAALEPPRAVRATSRHVPARAHCHRSRSLLGPIKPLGSRGTAGRERTNAARL
eukprot:2292366-Lingulodinium_polyedra.AAC.1